MEVYIPFSMVENTNEKIVRLKDKVRIRASRSRLARVMQQDQPQHD